MGDGDDARAVEGSSSYIFSIISSYISFSATSSTWAGPALTMPPTIKSSSKSLNSKDGEGVKVLPVVMWRLGEDASDRSLGG